MQRCHIAQWHDGLKRSVQDKLHPGWLHGEQHGSTHYFPVGCWSPMDCAWVSSRSLSMSQNVLHTAIDWQSTVAIRCTNSPNSLFSCPQSWQLSNLPSSCDSSVASTFYPTFTCRLELNMRLNNLKKWQTEEKCLFTTHCMWKRIASGVEWHGQDYLYLRWHVVCSGLATPGLRSHRDPLAFSTVLPRLSAGKISM